MEEFVGKVITLIGSSKESFEKAIANSVASASNTLREIHVADVRKLCKLKTVRLPAIGQRSG